MISFSVQVDINCPNLLHHGFVMMEILMEVTVHFCIARAKYNPLITMESTQNPIILNSSELAPFRIDRTQLNNLEI
jgi:hypothetical protein